jgi:hypothetical protein
MYANEQDRLRVELLVDPEVLCPGPDLSPIKPEYRESIENVLAQNPSEVYGPFTDYVLAQQFSKIVTGTRPVSATARQFRAVLLKGYGSWGKIDLIAAQVPFYYGLSSTKDDLGGRAPAPSETELIRNMLCRNLIAILSDPNMVFQAADYDLIHSSISALVAQTLLSVDEGNQLIAIMMGVPVTRAYDMGLTDIPDTVVLAVDVQWALRG